MTAVPVLHLSRPEDTVGRDWCLGRSGNVRSPPSPLACILPMQFISISWQTEIAGANQVYLGLLAQIHTCTTAYRMAFFNIEAKCYMKGMVTKTKTFSVVVYNLVCCSKRCQVSQSISVTEMCVNLKTAKKKKIQGLFLLTLVQ